MALPPFSTTVIPEYDTVSSQATWLIKFDGLPVARIIETESFDGPKYRAMTHGFETPPPWVTGRELPSYATARIAIMALVEDHVSTKEVRLRAG